MTLEGTCIHCGTDRPRTVFLCPRCGNPWIDARLSERAPESPDVPLAMPMLPPPERTGISPLKTAVIAVGVALVLVGVFSLGRRIFDSDETTAAPPTPTTTAAPTTTPPTTAPQQTTAAPTPTTTAAPPTTVAQLALPAPGEPVALDELTLGAFAIGPLDFEDPAEDVIATLLATFGPPEAYQDVSSGYGLCGAGAVAIWGPLTAVFEDGRFVAYRLEAGLPEHQASQLETLSGAALGDDTERLGAIYAGFDTVITDDRYTVSGTSDGRLLLWGPVIDGVVGGIYSANPCDAGTD